MSEFGVRKNKVPEYVAALPDYAISTMIDMRLQGSTIMEIHDYTGFTRDVVKFVLNQAMSDGKITAEKLRAAKYLRRSGKDPVDWTKLKFGLCTVDEVYERLEKNSENHLTSRA